jgi:hypothetical protein
MKKDILKIAGVKSEAEFYKKFPTEEAFKKAFPKEFKKAKMGAAMVKKQLTQLTDFSNPPQAQMGSYIGGEQAPSFKAANYTDLYDQADYAVTGSNRKMRMEDQALAAQQAMAKNSKKNGIFDMLGQLAPQLDALSSDTVGTGTMDAGGYNNGINETGASFADVGKYGKRVRKAQDGIISTPDFTKADKAMNRQFKFDNSKFNQGMQKFGKGVGKGYDKLDSSLGNIGGVQGALGVGTDLLEGFQQLKEEKNIQKGAHQFHELSGLNKQVAGLAPDIQQRKYDRPEDMQMDPNQFVQSRGSATNNPYLQMEYGGAIGGNPTEIQNMYNPGDIYSDMGYEPLSDSEIVKQYREGGFIPKAQFGGPFDKMAGQAGGALGSLIGGGKGRPTAGGKIGSTIGSTVGNLIVPGLGGIVGGAIGGIAGGIAGGKSAAKTERWQTEGEQNIQDAGFMSGARNIQGQNASFMEDGGWVSHDWQPQVITQFGGHNLKDLLRDDPTMDTLRSGGNLKDYSYTPPTAEALETMAMGGQLKTTWGGYAEPISHNPYLPGSGETVMFRGKSHEESDGNGHTGIGVKYGGGGHDSYTDYAEYGTKQADADVEVERGETGVELKDITTGETSMIVYGDMVVPSYVLSELGEKDAKEFKGKKFKNIDKEYAKQEMKQNKKIEKGLKLINSIYDDGPFGQLKFNAGKALVDGGNQELKIIADKRIGLAGGQNAILDTSKEFGVKSAELAKGKIKQDKDSDMAKFGGKFTQAQVGTEVFDIPLVRDQYGNPVYNQPIYGASLPEVVVTGKKAPAKSSSTKAAAKKEEKPLRTRLEPFVTIDTPRKLKKSTDVEMVPKIDAKVPDYARDMKAPKSVEQAKKDKSGIEDVLRQLQPYLIPSNQEDFDYRQIAPELASLAMNPLKAVQAQTFQPLLETPYSVSFQDQLNANQADFNALQRQMGYNPAAASALAAQKYAANSAILGQQFRANQEMQMGAYNRNRGILNDATLKNLAILDQQYVRGEQAATATKGQAQAALSSIADKIAKHKLENRTLGVYENMYNYRFGPKGRAINVNAPMDWNNLTVADLEALKKAKEIEEKKSGKKESTGKNGSLVKAIKNL